MQQSEVLSPVNATPNLGRHVNRRDVVRAFIASAVLGTLPPSARAEGSPLHPLVQALQENPDSPEVWKQIEARRDELIQLLNHDDWYKREDAQTEHHLLTGGIVENVVNPLAHAPLAESDIKNESYEQAMRRRRADETLHEKERSNPRRLLMQPAKGYAFLAQYSAKTGKKIVPVPEIAGRLEQQLLKPAHGKNTPAEVLEMILKRTGSTPSYNGNLDAITLQNVKDGVFIPMGNFGIIKTAKGAEILNLTDENCVGIATEQMEALTVPGVELSVSSFGKANWKTQAEWRARHTTISVPAFFPGKYNIEALIAGNPQTVELSDARSTYSVGGQMLSFYTEKKESGWEATLKIFILQEPPKGVSPETWKQHGYGVAHSNHYKLEGEDESMTPSMESTCDYNEVTVTFQCVKKPTKLTARIPTTFYPKSLQIDMKQFSAAFPEAEVPPPPPPSPPEPEEPFFEP